MVHGDGRASTGAENGVIEAPLIIDWPNRPRSKVCADTGKPSTTHWRIVSQADTAHGPVTRLALQPITGRTHQLRRLVIAVGQRESGFLVGHGDIDAGKARLAHPRDLGGEIFRLGGKPHHLAIDAKLAQPMAMQHRRERMGDGPADDACAFHVFRTPCSRNAASTGSSGKPRMEK